MQLHSRKRTKTGAVWCQKQAKPGSARSSCSMCLLQAWLPCKHGCPARMAALQEWLKIPLQPERLPYPAGLACPRGSQREMLWSFESAMKTGCPSTFPNIAVAEIAKSQHFPSAVTARSALLFPKLLEYFITTIQQRLTFPKLPSASAISAPNMSATANVNELILSDAAAKQHQDAASTPTARQQALDQRLLDLDQLFEQVSNAHACSCHAAIIAKACVSHAACCR